MFSTILHHRKNINFSSFSYHSSLLPPLLACRASSFLDREIMDTGLLQRVLKLVNLVVVELKNLLNLIKSAMKLKTRRYLSMIISDKIY